MGIKPNASAKINDERRGAHLTDSSMGVQEVSQLFARYFPLAHPKIGPFVKRYGRLFIAQSLPQGYERGKPKSCFLNAYLMALCNGLTYVEGYAYSPKIKVGLHHAWCVNDKGMVYDNTWKPAGTIYFGVPFQTDYMANTIRVRQEQSKCGSVNFSLLDEWEHRFPLINDLADKPDQWLKSQPG
jgi:hypothetical protein